MPQAPQASPAVPVRWQTVPSPVGPLVLAATPDGLCGLLFGPPERELSWLRDRLRGSGLVPDLRPVRGAPHALAAAHLDAARAQLAEYFAGRRRAFTLALDLRGTPFERAVWQALRGIPYGATRTYGEVAAEVGRPGAARAVGMACHRNPVAVVVPCHRVVGRGGALVGYGGGLEVKAFLLELEGARVPGRAAARA